MQKAESNVAKSTRKVTKGVAKSSVGKGAKNAQKIGRRVQNGVVVFLTSFWKSLIAIGTFLIPKPIRALFNRSGKWLSRRLGFVTQFATRWFRTRNYRLLIGSVPAILLSGILGFFAIRISLGGTPAKIAQYTNAAAAAIKRDDPVAAELFHRRLSQLGGMRPSSAYKAALFAFENGDRRAAIEQMQALAPLQSDLPGFAPAHSAMARWILAGEIKLPDKKKYELARAHIERAIEQNDADPIARLVRAEFWKQTGNLSGAIADFENVRRKIPSLGLGLVELYLSQNRLDKAIETLRSMDKFYSDRREQGAELDAMGCVYWGQVKLMLGETAEAEKLFAEGAEQHAENDFFRTQALSFFTVMANLSTGPTAKAAERTLTHIKRGLSLDKNNRELLNKMATMASGTDEAAVVAAKELESLQSSGEAPPILPAILGTLAAEKGDFETALPLLLQGVEDNPDDALTLNNAAWVQLQLELKKPPNERNELANAKAMIERALQIEPGRAIFHETRGQILLASGETQQAITELEISLNGLQTPDPEIHDALAKAYTQINNLNVARMHRAAARRLRGRLIP